MYADAKFMARGTFVDPDAWQPAEKRREISNTVTTYDDSFIQQMGKLILNLKRSMVFGEMIHLAENGKRCQMI